MLRLNWVMTSSFSHHCVYDVQLPLAAHHDLLRTTRQADVCVIGGGISGLTAAHRLHENGAGVVLLEAKHLGWGATGRNSGQLIPGFNRDVRELAAIYGEDDALSAYRGTLESLATLKQHIAESPDRCHFKPGVLMLALTPRAQQHLHIYQHYLANKLGRMMPTLTADETKAATGSPAYIGALLDADGGHFCSRSYVRLMASILVKNGVPIYENTPALRLNRIDGNYHITTPQGQVICRHIVVASNAYGDLLTKQRRHTVRLNAVMIATAPLSAAQQAEILAHDHAAFEWKHLLNYYRKTHDGRLVFGAGDAPLGASPKQFNRCFANARKRLLQVFPQLEKTPITHGWHGRISVSKTEMLDVGLADENLYYLQADAGHGLLPLHMAATAIADDISGKQNNFSTLQRMAAKPIWGAGKLDNLYARAGLVWYRMVDAIG